MNMFDPRKASEEIKNEFISYITTTYSFYNPSLRKQFAEELKKIVSAGPYVEVSSIFKTGNSISDLCRKGILSNLFFDLEKDKVGLKPILPLDRPLYAHQEKSIRSIVSGNNVVITTGTGSGKTNCFLIPVINELLREKEKGTLGPGIRALFIYPMNALANDQLKNIRKLLMDYPDITFGVYNGGTEQKDDEAIDVYKAMFVNEDISKLRNPLPNELLSREQMKRTPPNILFTNYAMLEHLLFRPSDDVLFQRSDFKFVVLDEAHIYSGATGIETAILLRRLRARISQSNPQFILTSATLGGKSADDDIVTFARNLCGASFDKANIIRSEKEPYSGNVAGKYNDPGLLEELADDGNDVKDVLEKHHIPFDANAEDGELIYDFLLSCGQYISLKNIISGKDKTVLTIDEVANNATYGDKECAVALLALCQRAIKDGKHLIESRYHFFIRALEGAFVTLTGGMKLSLTRKKDIDGDCVFEIAVCPKCGHFALVGKISGGKLIQASKLSDNIDYFVPAEEVEDEKYAKFALCPHCGAIKEYRGKTSSICDHDPGEQLIIAKIDRSADGSSYKCKNCANDNYSRLYLGNDAATSVLATALYESLPTTKVVKNNVSTPSDNWFTDDIIGPRKEEKSFPGQFLVFSDSRQEAAKFACYLSDSYKEFLRRRGICYLTNESGGEMAEHPWSVGDFAKKTSALFSNNKTFVEFGENDKSSLASSESNSWLGLINEMVRASSPTSLTSLGFLQFHHCAFDRFNYESFKSFLEKRGYRPKNAVSIKTLFELLIFDIAKYGAVIANSMSTLGTRELEYLFYTGNQPFVVESDDNGSKLLRRFIPEQYPGKPTYHQSFNLYVAKALLHCDDQKAIFFLRQFFHLLISPNKLGRPVLVSPNKDSTYCLKAEDFQILVPGAKGAKWYRCKKCGKVSQFSIEGKCSSFRCDGEVEEVNPLKLHQDNHFANLYSSKRLSPLYIKEHTAQLSKHESAVYQEAFIKKELNALSCSTTFEMGVDVGDLETVFLRDVPPLPSNYSQRAGRAGRSADSAAYCLTYAKLSSHDFSYFNHPEDMIKGEIRPPLFKLDNEKIVKRHVYDIALSYYFHEHPDQYNHNSADKFINDKGYADFVNWLKTKPSGLQDLIKRSIPEVDNLHERIGLNDFSWLEDFIGDNGVFTNVVRQYENNIAEFKRQLEEAHKSYASDTERAIKNNLKDYQSNELIDFLARGNVLPRYGFPVDTVELQQITTGKNEKALRLSRDLSMAIAEYAPSSEVVADGRLYTSRYIKKVSDFGDNKRWRLARIAICPNENCKAVNFLETTVPNEGVKCIGCGEIIPKEKFFDSIEPRSGFATEKRSKDVPLRRQEKNYRSEDIYICDQNANTIKEYEYNFNGTNVSVQSTTNDSLLVKSVTPFYVCPVCGFSYGADESIPNDAKANAQMENQFAKIDTCKAHTPIDSNLPCSNKTLEKRYLHHLFKTDVAKINFDCDTSDFETMISTAYAILYAVTGSMNIERKDLKVCLSKKVTSKVQNSIIIYDAVPGGAGHSRRLVTDDGKTLYNIFKIAYHNMVSCTCDPSCYNCLRSYDNQKIHDQLDRKKAAKFLEQLLNPCDRL